MDPEVAGSKPVTHPIPSPLPQLTINGPVSPNRLLSKVLRSRHSTISCVLSKCGWGMCGRREPRWRSLARVIGDYSGRAGG